MSLEKHGKHIFLPKTDKRKQMELVEIERRWQYLQRSEFYSAIRFAGEVKSGLLNHQGYYLTPEQIVNVPALSVQLLPFDDQSPFGSRKMIVNFGSFNSCRPVSQKKFWFAPDVLHDTSQMHPTIKEAIWEHQIIRVFELANQQVEEQKSDGGHHFAAQSSQDSGSCSLTYPHHVQAIWLSEGIEPFHDYDFDQCADIQDMPKLIKRANDLKLMLNIRAIGDGKILVQGVYPLGYRSGDLPVKPPIDNDTVMPWLRFMALRFGAVESFTNALSPNDLVFEYVNRLGAELIYNLDWIRDYALKVHHQFDARKLVNDNMYRLTLIKAARTDLLQQLNRERKELMVGSDHRYNFKELSEPVANMTRFKTSARSGQSRNYA